MVKSRWKESMKYFGGLIDPEKDEELRKTKLDVDDKVAKITKLLQNNEDKKGGEGDSNNNKNSEVVELINDFHKQYQTLYTLYDNIKGEVTGSVNNHDSNEATSSTTSSDSESYYSTGELSARSSPSLDNIRDAFKQKNDTFTPASTTTNTELIELRNRLNALSEEKEAMGFENAASLRRLKESEKIISDLRVEVERSEAIKQECNQLKAKLAEKESKVAAQMKDMESQLYSLRMEQKRWFSEKKLLEEKISGSGKLGEENLGLLARILELQETSQGKDRTIKDLKNYHGLEPDEQIVFKGNDASAQVQGIMDQVDVLQEELHSLIKQKSESESNLERANQELSEARVQIANLKEDLGSKATDFHKLLQKNAGFEQIMKDLEEQMGNARNEAKDLQEEKQGFVKRISLLEKSLQERDGDAQKLQEELHSLQTEKSEKESRIDKEKQKLSDSLSEMEQQNAELIKKLTDHQTTTKSQEETIKKLEEDLESAENEKKNNQKEKEDLSVKIAKLEEQNNALNTKIGENQATLKNQEDTMNSLQQELESLKTAKTQLTQEIEEEKVIEKENIELRNKIEEFETIAKTQEQLIDKLTTEINQIKGTYQDSKANLTLAEKKIEETADEFYKKFEDTLRILSRRIRVAEQLHLENKEVCNKTKAKYENENTYLKEKIATTEVSVLQMKEITISASDMLTGLDGLALKFEECSGNFMNRISKVSCEVLFVKDWVKRKNNTVKHVQEDIMCLVKQVDVKENEVLGLREKVWKMENKVRELEKTMIDKEESLLGMEEEKREAIRQLCVWIDYHRSRSDYLKRILSEVYAVRSQRAT